MSEKKIRYDINQLRRDLQDEYLAAMLVGFDENTPDLMDLQMASPAELLAAAPQYGYKIEDYIIEDDEEKNENKTSK